MIESVLEEEVMVRNDREAYYSGSTDIGCVLIHGFDGSYFEFSFLADLLKKNNISYELLKLKCHRDNDAPDDRIQFHWEDTISDCTDSLERLKLQGKRTYIVGLSAGSTLAVYLASTFGTLIDGIISISLATMWRDRVIFENIEKHLKRNGFFSAWFKIFPMTFSNAMKLLSLFRKILSIKIINKIFYEYQFRYYHESHRDDERGTPLEKSPYAVLTEIYSVVKATERQLSKITDTPIFFIQSDNDFLIDFEDFISFIDKIPSPYKHIVAVESEVHDLPIHRQFRDTVCSLVVEYLLKRDIPTDYIEKAGILSEYKNGNSNRKENRKKQ